MQDSAETGLISPSPRKFKNSSRRHYSSDSDRPKSSGPSKFLSFLPMQVQLNLKNLCVVLIGVFFIYLVYLLWGSGSPQLDVWVDLKLLINYSIIAVEKGGLAVRLVHEEKKLNIETKSKTKEGRDEYVTKADLISNQVILDSLKRFPGIKIISEEKTQVADSELEKYKQNNYDTWKASLDLLQNIPSEKIPLSDLGMWIDPLDATQEFTEDLLEYVTVMACIVVRGRPKFGVIYRPFQYQTVWGLVNHGVFPIGSTLDASSSPNKTIVVSRSHAGEVGELANLAFGTEYTVEPAGGSGYKSLRVLNGTATMYLHKTAIKKWDICAGDAILRAAGGRMTNLFGSDLTYFPDDPEVKNTKGLLAVLRDSFAFLGKLSSHISAP